MPLNNQGRAERAVPLPIVAPMNIDLFESCFLLGGNDGFRHHAFFGFGFCQNRRNENARNVFRTAKLTEIIGRGLPKVRPETNVKFYMLASEVATFQQKQQKDGRNSQQQLDGH